MRPISPKPCRSLLPGLPNPLRLGPLRKSAIATAMLAPPPKRSKPKAATKDAPTPAAPRKRSPPAAAPAPRKRDKKLDLKVGDNVDALWPADGEYYPAKVRAVNADGTIALDYADGDRRNDATTSELRRKRQATPAEADPDFAPAAPPTADAPAARSTITDKKALEARMAADGWTKEEKQREGSATVDKYWIDPNGGKKCRSLIEVARRAYPEFVTENSDAPKRTAKKSLEDLIGERLIAPGPIVFSWPMTGEVRVRAEGILNASGKIWYEGNEYVPTGFARRAFQACNVDPSATGTTFINGYDYLTMKGSGVRIKDLR